MDRDASEIRGFGDPFSLCSPSDPAIESQHRQAENLKDLKQQPGVSWASSLPRLHTGDVIKDTERNRCIRVKTHRADAVGQAAIDHRRGFISDIISDIIICYAMRGDCERCRCCSCSPWQRTTWNKSISRLTCGFQNGVSRLVDFALRVKRPLACIFFLKLHKYKSKNVKWKDDELTGWLKPTYYARLTLWVLLCFHLGLCCSYKHP